MKGGENDMERIELKVEKRTLLGKKVKRLRRQGLIPAIIYGHKTEPIPVQIEERELTRVLAQAGPQPADHPEARWAAQVGLGP